MSALDHFSSLDATIVRIRAEHDAELSAMKDQLLAANLELAMHKDMLLRAIEARAQAERVTAGLLQQFGTVAHVFDQAKRLALEAGFKMEDEIAKVIPKGVFVELGKAPIELDASPDKVSLLPRNQM